MSSKGFTLLETLIAMMIVAGGIIVISNAWSGNFMRVRKAALNQEVAHLLERKVLEIELEYKDQINALPEEASGDFGSDFPRYRWEMESRPFELPDMSSIIMEQEKGPTSAELLSTIKQIQEFSRKVIKEVKITVFVKAGQRETPYSVATLFIDYSQEFSIPGLAALSGGTGDSSSGTQSGSQSESQQPDPSGRTP